MEEVDEDAGRKFTSTAYLQGSHTNTLTSSQVMCIGRNYADHIKELSSATPKQPFFFLKPPSSILLPGAGPVLRPRGVNMHYEVELGLIMGKTLRDLHPDDTKGAMDAIEGTFSFCFCTKTLTTSDCPLSFCSRICTNYRSI